MSQEEVFLGKGRYGNVIKIEDHTGKEIALKKIKPENLNLVEIDILSRVKSPYLLRSIQEIQDLTEDTDGIKLELKENNLKNLDISDLTAGQIKRVIMSLIYGLECLHKSGFLHLDLKPMNCLYDYKDGMYTAYISDFGFSLRCENPYSGILRTQRAGSLKYYPYEFLEPSSEYYFNDKSDVWSLGVTILSFLGMNYSMDFKIEDTTEEKTKTVKNFWDKNSPQKLIHDNVNKTKLSNRDKIDLIELLVNMMKKDKQERISSKDFNMLRFYNSNTLENSCYVSKPKEILYIPYTSSNVTRGINQLNYYFENIVPDIKVEVYFLCIEIFIRIMAITPMEISNQTLESHIQKSFLSALNYYKESDIKFRAIKNTKAMGYDVSRYLNGDIAPNIYFYASEYADDLYLIKDILFKNYNLVCLYNYLDVKSVLDYFRQNYTYKGGEKNKIKTFMDLLSMDKPVKGTSRMIENDRDIFSYKNLNKNTRLNKEFVTSLIYIREAENIFKSKLLSFFDTRIKKLDKIDDIFRFYVDFFEKKDISLSKFLLTEKNNQPESFSDRFCKYAIIEKNIYDNINVIGDLKNKHVIFKDSKNYSLLVIEESTKMITHYFSTYNEILYEYFKKNLPEFKYTINYEMKTSSVCKINELCIVFLIYYSITNLKDDYNMIYVQDDTLKTVLEICYSFLSEDT